MKIYVDFKHVKGREFKAFYILTWSNKKGLFQMLQKYLFLTL